MRNIFCFIILFLAVGLSNSQTNQLEIAFVDINVVPMDREIILENQSVIIKNGIISEIGPSDEISISDAVFKINGKGKYLMPGLADMHVHTWNENELILFIVNGVTTVRNMGGAPLHLELRERVREGKLLGPNIITAGPVIDGSPPIWQSSLEVQDPSQLNNIIAEQKKLGYDFLKIYNNLSEEVFDSLMVLSIYYDIPVAGHVPFLVSLEKALESGISSIEHFESYGLALQSDDSPYKDFFRASQSYAWVYMDEEKLSNIIQKTVESGVWNCPTMVVFQKLFVKPDKVDSMLNLSEMQYVIPQALDNWGKRYYKIELAERKDEIYYARRKLLKALHDSNANLLLGTDCGNPFTVHGFSIHEELQYLIDAGFSPYEAIKTGTVNAAEFLNASEEFGMVKTGMRADLICVDENPLEDIENVRKISGVMVRGKLLPEEELNMMLEKIAASYKREK
ncbi:MAG: amidohydrolase family protein [Asgard group archaeon]|nr:amidohydrolase family protein [Asgard group archaeon]